MTRAHSAAPSAWPAFVTAVLMLAQFVGSKAVRDAFFLSEFPATDLPAAMIAAGLVTIAGTAVASMLLARFGPARVSPWLFFVSAMVMIGLWGAAPIAPRPVAAALYLHVALFGPLAISGFWSLLNETFDPHSAKSTLARVSAFAALGGIVGGLGANAVSGWVGVENVLACLAALHLACGLGVAVVAGRGGAGAHPGDDGSTAESGVAVLRRSSYLQRMVLLVVVCAVVDAMLDYAMKAAAAGALEPGRLMRFFGYYYTATGVLTFVVQAGIGARVLRRFGLGGAMGVLPVSILGLGTVAMIWPRLAPIVVARAAESVFSNSLFSAGFQLLYTPLAPGDKRPAKPYVDVAAQRAGGVVGGAIIMGLLFLAPDLPLSVVIGLAIAAAAVGLAMVVLLHRGYVRELERSLRSGTVQLSADEALDATTAQTLAGTALGLDRASLLEQIRARQAGSETASDGPAASSSPAAAAPSAPAPADHALAVEDALFVETARSLLGGDAELVRELLGKGPRDPRLAPLVIPLLVRDDLGDLPLRYLQKLSTRIPGQLLDALLGSDVSLEVRRRLPRTLERCPGKQALPRLVLAIDDDDALVALRAAQTAVRMVARAPDLRIEPARAHAWMQAAFDRDDRALQQSIGRLADDERRSVFGGASSEAGVAKRPPRLELAFTLLALAQPLEVVRAAALGVVQHDPMLRGTALEYLETTLPAELFSAIFDLVRAQGESMPRTGAVAGGRDIEAELLATSRHLERPDIGGEQ